MSLGREPKNVDETNRPQIQYRGLAPVRVIKKERKRENVWKEGLVHAQSLAEKERDYRWGVGKGGDGSTVQSRWLS